MTRGTWWHVSVWSPSPEGRWLNATSATPGSTCPAPKSASPTSRRRTPASSAKTPNLTFGARTARAWALESTFWTDVARAPPPSTNSDRDRRWVQKRKGSDCVINFAPHQFYISSTFLTVFCLFVCLRKAIITLVDALKRKDSTEVSKRMSCSRRLLWDAFDRNEDDGLHLFMWGFFFLSLD